METTRAKFNEIYQTALNTNKREELIPLYTQLGQLIFEVEESWPDEAIQLSFSLQLLQKVKSKLGLADNQSKASVLTRI